MKAIAPISVALVLLLSPWRAAAGMAPSRADASSFATQAADTKNVKDAAQFRAEFGFASDRVTISALLADGSTDYSFGAPLSRLELANMQNRLALRESAEPVVAYVASRPDDFGGLYFTQDTGEMVIHLLPVLGVPGDITAKALALAPAGLPAIAESIAFSMSDLLGGEKQLAARRGQLGINELAVDVKGNALNVVLAPGAAQSPIVGAVDVQTHVSFGPAPVPAFCGVNSCTPYRGGLAIVGSTHNQLCTWGFYGTRGSAEKYSITAGHCGSVGETMKIAGAVFTDGVDKNTYQMVSKFQLSDSMTAHVRGSSNAVSPFNTIFASPTDTAHTITAQRSTGSQVVGDPVCFEGVVTGTSLCGVIELTGLNYDLTRPYDGQTINLSGQIRMSRNGREGDSGGPVYQSHTAYGVLNALAGGTGHVQYSTIQNVEADMGNTIICMSSAC